MTTAAARMRTSNKPPYLFRKDAVRDSEADCSAIGGEFKGGFRGAIQLPFAFSSNCYFFVGAKDVAHGVANFAYSGVGLYGVEEERHKVVFPFGCFAYGVEAAV